MESVQSGDKKGVEAKWESSTEELIKQQRRGIKHNLMINTFSSCLLVSDYFPSILWLLNSSSTFSNIYVFICDNKFEKEIKICWSETVCVVNMNEALKLLNSPRVLKFGIGGIKFLWSIWKNMAGVKWTNTVFVTGYDRLRGGEFKGCGIRWTRFSHRSLGGLTERRWMLGTSRDSKSKFRLWEIPNLGMHRTMTSVIDEGISGTICDAPSDRSHLSCWRPESVNKAFSWPSYKSKTGWVHRVLSFKEMALVFDVNELIIQKIVDVPELLNLKADISSGRWVPNKVLQVGIDWAFTNWGERKDLESVQSTVSMQLEDREEDLSDEDKKYLELEDKYLIKYGEKASKNDDEVVPVELWDRSVLRRKFDWLAYSGKVVQALHILREKFALKWYLKMLRKSLFNFLRSKYGKNWWRKNTSQIINNRKRKRTPCSTSSLKLMEDFNKDIAVGRDVLIRAGLSSWWEWTAGSTCNFWRWPIQIRNQVRDGVPIYIEKKLPQYKQRQVLHLGDRELIQLRNKISKVINRRYLEGGYVASLINYFAVPKGDDDIRIVYDGTKCGLNQCVWAPNFYLPSVDSLLMSVSASTWFSDMDLGEMFLNFYIDEKLRPYVGVDLTKLELGSCNQSWMRWNRTLMGFRSSPYIACKLYGWTMDMARGNRFDPINPFRWDSVRINLPGMADYDPQLPWVTKMVGEVEASDVKTYVDDVRPFGSSESRCRVAGKKISKITQYLGEQDAPRKFRPPSQRPGPWCGSFVAVENKCVFAYVSQKKWDKAKAYISGWRNIMVESRKNSTLAEYDHKLMEQGRGFLVYLSRTYTSMIPYLKGIHLTLDSWRTGRDQHGWKLKFNARRNMENIILSSNSLEDKIETKAPRTVNAVPRLADDLEALWEFFKPDSPPWRFVRGRTIYLAKYGFGDASKSGFGSTFQTEDGISYRFGTWGRDGESNSSNFRELENLAKSLEMEVFSGSLKGAEVFICTDNATAESAYYKGTSSSRLLFEIVLRLRKLEFIHGIKIFFIHVAGSRMIAQGTDGLSRGDLSEGVMKGSKMLTFIPFHLTAFQRSKRLKSWFESWMTPALNQNENLEFLDETGWFWRGHDLIGGTCNRDGVWTPEFKPGIFIWSPAPAAGQFAVEQLREARNKRVHSLHVFVIPRLFSSIWRRQLYKVSDIVLTLPFVDGIWTKKNYHEPLTIAFIFPFLAHSPWQLKRSKAFLEMEGLLRKMWSISEVSTGAILRQLLLKTRDLASMPESLVCKMLQSAQRFKLLHNETGK